MLLSIANKKEIDISAKKTKPTQENEEISNDKKSNEKEMQLFKYKATENNIGENPINNKRIDKFGNPIIKNGKQRVTFIDKITTKKFEDVIKIESYKDYNKTEEVKSKNSFNTCCFLVWFFLIISLCILAKENSIKNYL